MKNIRDILHILSPLGISPDKLTFEQTQQLTDMINTMGEITPETVNSIKSILGLTYDKKEKPVPRSVNIKIGRNELCPCESGKKYKKCCGNNEVIVTPK